MKYFKQETDYTCGQASLRMVLSSFGKNVSEKRLIKLMKPSRKTGTSVQKMVSAAKRFKLNHIEMKKGNVKDIRKLLKENCRIIVRFHYIPENFDHYVVVKRITPKEIYFLDSYFGKNVKYSLNEFKKSWFSKYPKGKNWLMAVKID